MKQEAYSVLMPLYYKENPEYLSDSLSSMMKQTIKPDEIVMIQDHPIPSVLEKVIRNLEKIHGIEVNIYENFELDGKGLSAVLAYGVKKCRNSLIARMDTDDIAVWTRCEQELKVFARNPECALVGTWVDEFEGETGNVVTVRTVPGTMKGIIQRMKVTNAFNHPSVMFRKEAVLKSGNYNTKCTADEDYDLWYRMIINGYKAVNIQKSLVKFRLGKNFSRRRRTRQAFQAKTGIKRKMYQDGFMNMFEYACTIALEYIYLYCPADIRKMLFNREKKRLEKVKEKHDYYKSTIPGKFLRGRQ